MAGAWTRKEGKNPEGGLNAKGRASLRAQGHDIKPPVSAKQAKKSPKAAARRKSFCARMGGMEGPMKDEKGRPTRKALALRKWDCKADGGLVTGENIAEGNTVVPDITFMAQPLAAQPQPTQSLAVYPQGLLPLAVNPLADPAHTAAIRARRVAQLGEPRVVQLEQAQAARMLGIKPQAPVVDRAAEKAARAAAMRARRVAQLGEARVAQLEQAQAARQGALPGGMVSPAIMPPSYVPTGAPMPVQSYTQLAQPQMAPLSIQPQGLIR